MAADENSEKAKLQLSQAQKSILMAVASLSEEVTIELQRSTNEKNLTLELSLGSIAALRLKLSEALKMP